MRDQRDSFNSYSNRLPASFVVNARATTMLGDDPDTGAHVPDTESNDRGPWQVQAPSSGTKETFIDNAAIENGSLNIVPDVLHRELGLINVLYHNQDGSDREADVGNILTEGESLAASSWHHRLNRCVKENKLLCAGISATLACLALNWVLMELVSARLEDDIRQDLVLRERTSTRWTQPNVNAVLSLHTFTVRVQTDGSLVVSEMDPLIYSLDIQKVNVTWHSNSSVSYQEQLTLHNHDPIRHEVAFRKILELVIKNATGDHMMNVFTGASNARLTSQTFSWNYNRELPFWKSEDANEVTGTDGSVFQPFLDESTTLTLFYPQLRRKFDLEFLESSSFKGLPVYRFAVANSQFFNNTEMTSSTHNRARAVQDSLQQVGNGYCNPTCLPNGMYIFRPDETGTSLYISLPHFLGADPYYTRHVEGIEPVESKHRPVFEVDKLTGITVRQKRRFQVNMQHELNGMQVFQPIYWFELSVEVGDDVLRYIEQAHLSFQVLYGASICLGLLLVLSLTVLVFCLVCRNKKKRSRIRQYVRLTTLPGRGCCPRL